MAPRDQVTGEATRIPRQLDVESARRLERLRRVAWWLDRAFTVGGNRRFGLDPLLGLLPGIGDWLGGGISLYVVYEALRIGLPWPVIARMAGNVLVESTVGAIPVAGDVFDFIWQANYRNLRLVERHADPRLKPRSLRGIAVAFGVLLVLVVVLITLAVWGVVQLLQWLFAG